MFTQLNQYHVVLEAAPDFQRTPHDLGEIYLHTAASGRVPLSAVAHWEESNAPLAINHQGQLPVVTLSFNLAPQASLGSAVGAINKAMTELQMPASVQGNFQGTARAFESSLQNELLLVLAAVVTVYIVLGVLYESYIHPITILSTLPSAGVGAILALLLCNTQFSVIALIGMILLIGIVMKNAIMMIDFALDLQRNENKSAQEAIFQACLLRFRPITMTTMAALFAGLPLALGTGIGSELRSPLGIAIVGGLIFSQLLTLFTTPVIYLTFDGIASAVAAFGKRRAQRRDARLSTPPPLPPMGRRSHEHFAAVYLPSSGHDVAGDRHRAGGHSRLRAAAGLAAAGGGLSGHQRVGIAAGCQPRDDGLVGGDTAGASAWPHRRHHGDDLLKFAGFGQYHHPVRAHPQHRRRRPRRAGRHQCRRQSVAGDAQ
jgi:hypothetical protein